MFKEFLLAVASGLGFATVSDRTLLRQEERERQVLFVQRKNQRQAEELLRHQAELRRKEEERCLLARQQAELQFKRQELARQQNLLARQRDADLAWQRKPAQRSKPKISDLL